MIVRQGSVPAAVCVMCAAWISFAHAAADRDKLLGEPGMYGTFAAFSPRGQLGEAGSGRTDRPLTAMKGVVEQHREKVAIDVYLTRGLSDYADILFRVHATELRGTQRFETLAQ